MTDSLLNPSLPLDVRIINFDDIKIVIINVIVVFLVEKIQSRSVPTPVSLVRYISDPGYEHEDFTLTSACTLRARVSDNTVCVAV